MFTVLMELPEAFTLLLLISVSMKAWKSLRQLEKLRRYDIKHTPKKVSS